MSVRSGAATHAGNLRDSNQDAFLATAPVFLVADGMGGHADGALAARTVVESFSSALADAWLTPERVHEALALAGDRLAALPAAERAPGSTVSGVGLANHDDVPCWLVFNLGDSRTYRLHDGDLEQITVDHTHVQELVDGGEIQPGEAREHRLRNVVTRALGAGSRRAPIPDQWLLIATEGDRVLICSDGLYGEVTDQLIAAILMTAEDPQVAADELVAAAVAASGRDNVTAVVVDAVRVHARREVAVNQLDVTDPGSFPTTPGGDTLPDEESLAPSSPVPA